MAVVNFMNNQKVLNIIGDLDRSVIFYAQDPNPSSRNCSWLQNIIKTLPELSKIDPKLSELINIKYLQSDSDAPLVKAERLLMMSHYLFNYLEYGSK